MPKERTDNSCVLSVKDIKKSFGRKPVLIGGTLEAHTGSFICIVGENGSGKSTLLKIISGFLKADGGKLWRTARMGYCPQEALLYDYLTVEEHFRLFGAAYRMLPDDIAVKSRDLMETFSFSQYSTYPIHQLSGGTRQKLNVSLALLHNPDLLLLDEPYAGFDWETYQRFLSFATNRTMNDTCIVMVSHLVYSRDQFDAVYTLNRGVIHEDAK